MITSAGWTLFLQIALLLTQTLGDIPPNIVFILADDLGWNDVGFHGSNEIPTPNIDALAFTGVILNNYYVMPICTPSRSALMTGKHPIHTGMQHTVLFGAEPRGLPLEEKLLPEYLTELGYTNHMVGKWHLGHYKKEYTPLYRGFQSHVGFWTGHHDYFDHTAHETGTWGLDMRRGLEVAYDLHGQYSTEIFSREASAIIRAHNTSTPLFLYVAHAAMHSSNPYSPIPVPDALAASPIFSHIHDFHRRQYAIALHKLDESVGMVVEALSERKMLENTIIVFSSDNGGPAAGFNLNAASNWPLRGVKNTLWEGGVRGAGLIWSSAFENPGRVSSQLMDITDWLPTLVAAANGTFDSDIDGIDGQDVWSSLVSEDDSVNRTLLIHNIDDIYRSSAIRFGQWKLVKGTNYEGKWDGWYGPSGRNLHHYDIDLILNSHTGRALKKIHRAPTPEQISNLRRESEVVCSHRSSNDSAPCFPLKKPCLFNIEEDPCERYNLAEREPELLKDLLDLLRKVNETAVPPGNLPLDPQGLPQRWGYVWTNFGDLITENDVM